METSSGAVDAGVSALFRAECEPMYRPAYVISGQTPGPSAETTVSLTDGTVVLRFSDTGIEIPLEAC